MQRAAYYGYDLGKPHQVAIVSFARLAEFLQMQKLKDEKALVALKARFEAIVRDSLKLQGRNVLQMLLADDVVLLMPCEDESNGAQQNIDILKAVFEKLAAEMPGLTVAAALGGRFEHLQGARKSYLQAITVLRSFSVLKTTSCPIYAYEQLGIYKLLFEIGSEKLALYYQEIIEPLDEYDRKHHMDLVNSLFVYFEENCNVAKTAKRLFIHRNTLDYRLKKIAEITGRNLTDPYDRLTLQLGVVVGKQIANAAGSFDL
jgi:sugar diacid utilization regulator